MARWGERGWKNSWSRSLARRNALERKMEEAPEKGKETSHSAHANAMNEWLQTLPNLCNRYVAEGPLQVTTEYTHGQLFMYTQLSPYEICNERYATKTNSSLNTAFISTVDSVDKKTMIMTWNTSQHYYKIFLTKVNTSTHWKLYQHGRQSNKVNPTYCSIQTIIHKTIQMSYSTIHLKSYFLNNKF